MVAAIGLVIGFESSSALAAAYGIAVTTTMVITSLLFYVLARHVWKWPAYYIVPLTILFLIIDSAFLGANLDKVVHGGWFPILIAAIVYILMSTWRDGRKALWQRLTKIAMPTERFLQLIESDKPMRVTGTAVFMSGSQDSVPPALLHNLKHNKILHEQIILLHVLTEPVPHVKRDERAKIEQLSNGFHRVILHYGFLDDRNIPFALDLLADEILKLDPKNVTYFLGRENLLVSSEPLMSRWRTRLFTGMSRNAQPATAFFNLPPNRVIELGAQIQV
jgi:KUP system potassium uptake protein